MSAATSSQWTEREATRETMQVIFDSLRYLIEVDLSEGSFASPRNRQEVLEALRELDAQSAILSSHGFSDDAGGIFLASVLERYSLLLLRSFERDEPERVQRFLYGITDICIACHTRLPSPDDSPVSKDFVDSRAVASLPPEKRARIQVATRRFDDALDTLESLIEESRFEDSAAMEDVLRTYLIINIRVRGDMERPIPILESIEERGPQLSMWQRDIGFWLDRLRELRDDPFIDNSLESAREMIEAAGKADFPNRRSALVEYIAASSLLNRFLVSEPPDTMEIAEAHYLLGLAEYQIYRDDWLPQAELYLEIAIVLAPDAPWARQAYALLVEKIERTYMRTPDGRLPPDVEERLIELREAIEGARSPKADWDHAPVKAFA